MVGMIYKASILFILVFAYGCVQKTYNKTAVFLLNVGKQTKVRNEASEEVISLSIGYQIQR